MELLLEGYLGEFHEIELQLTSMLNQIVDAREFTNTHQVFLNTFYSVLVLYFKLYAFDLFF
jgi:hypothetical protein